VHHFTAARFVAALAANEADIRQPAPPYGVATLATGDHGGPRTAERPQTRAGDDQAEAKPQATPAETTQGCNLPVPAASHPERARADPQTSPRLDAGAITADTPVPPPYRHQPPHPHQEKTAARLSRSQIRGRSSSSHHEEHSRGRLAGDLAPGPPPWHASTLRRPDQRRPEHAPPRREPPRNFRRRGRPLPPRRRPAAAVAKGSSGRGGAWRRRRLGFPRAAPSGSDAGSERGLCRFYSINNFDLINSVIGTTQSNIKGTIYLQATQVTSRTRSLTTPFKWVCTVKDLQALPITLTQYSIIKLNVKPEPKSSLHTLTEFSSTSNAQPLYSVQLMDEPVQLQTNSNT
jgi:hypothetical protein